MKKLQALIAISFLLAAHPLAAQPGDDPAIQKVEFIYDSGPYPQIHASTIVETPSGLVAAWFGGTYEKHPDVGIWVSRQVDGKWTESVEVANGIQYEAIDGTVVRHPTWNPVLFQPSTGPLMLFYKAGPNPESWWGMLTTSADAGKTWGAACRLPEGIVGPVKNKPIELADGTLLCPTSSEDQGWRVHFEFTADLGLSWSRTQAVNDGKKIDAIQPSILSLGGQKLLALGRTKNGQIFNITSNDNGRTWSEMKLSSLPNNNSGTDAVTLADGRHLLIYNHTTKGRTPLNIALSEDGMRWQAAVVLENEPGEYSYPAIIQSQDGLVHATYTWKRQKVKHVVIDPSKLSLKPLPTGN
jgi:predicted neuraminidase